MPQGARARADLDDDALPRAGRPGGPQHRLRVVSATEVAAPSRTARVVHVERRRRPRRPLERLGSRPDRIAMWAVVMALALIVVAATSSHP